MNTSDFEPSALLPLGAVIKFPDGFRQVVAECTKDSFVEITDLEGYLAQLGDA